MKGPVIYTVDNLVEMVNNGNAYALVDGDYVPARPYGFDCWSLQNRIKAAWLVFTGKADVVVWKGQ